MDELDIKGKKYISSKRAAEITGYAKDYVGQLARGGKIAATRFGRAWYVEESALMAHVNAESKEEGGTVLKAPQNKRVPILSPHLYKPYNFPNTWGSVQYFHDTSELLPVIAKQTSTAVAEEPSHQVRLHTPSPVSSQKKVEDTGKRIRILEDGIIRKNPMIRLPEPLIQSTAVPVAKKAPKRKGIALQYRMLPVSLVAASFALFLFAVSGLFVGTGAEYIPSQDAYTASVLPSFEHIAAILKDSPFVQAGVDSFGVFVKTISNSFWTFFEGGLNFVKSI